MWGKPLTSFRVVRNNLCMHKIREPVYYNNMNKVISFECIVQFESSNKQKLKRIFHITSFPSEHFSRRGLSMSSAILLINAET